MLNVKALLNKILNNIEYRELVWTNPSPSASFSNPWLELEHPLSVGETLEIECYRDITNTSIMTFRGEYRPDASIRMFDVLPQANGTMSSLVRNASAYSGDTAKIAFDSCKVGYSTVGNGNMIPYRIYRIRKWGGY